MTPMELYAVIGRARALLAETRNLHATHLDANGVAERLHALASLLASATPPSSEEGGRVETSADPPPKAPTRTWRRKS